MPDIPVSSPGKKEIEEIEKDCLLPKLVHKKSPQLKWRFEMQESLPLTSKRRTEVLYFEVLHILSIIIKVIKLLHGKKIVECIALSCF